MNIHRIYILLIGIVLVASCRKDQDGVVLNDINEAKIGAAETDFSVIQLDRLAITPTISETIPSGDTYTYEWAAIGNVPNTVSVSRTLLSTHRNLDTIINLPPSLYLIRYTITNTRTGLRAFQTYNLVVNGAFSSGWFVTNNKSGKANLSFIRTDNSVFLNPVEEINKRTYPGTALGTFYSSAMPFFLFLTQEGVYRFNPNDFTLLSEGESIINKAHFESPVYSSSRGAHDQFLVDEGNIYAGVGSFGMPPTEPLKPLTERLPGDYEVFPAIITNNSNFTYFYDNKYERFLELGRLSRIPTIATSKNNIFDMANVGKRMIAYDKGTVTQLGDVDYFVMEDELGRYLYALRTNSSAGVTPYINQKIEYSTTPEFWNARSFAVSSVVEQMYYSVNNKIYLYTVPTNSAELIYTFPGGYQIKDMKVSKPNSNQLIVGVDHDVEGEVYYFDINPQGRFVNSTFSQKFTGFGEIVQLKQKD